MSWATDILTAHSIAERAILDAIDSAVDASNASVLEHLDHILEVNNNAYAFLVLARFESAVKDLTKQCILLMRSQPDGVAARPWGVINHESLFFLNHVALLTDKGGSDYREVQELYKDRNAIAHGKFAETKPNVPAIAAKLSGILSRLEGTP